MFFPYEGFSKNSRVLPVKEYNGKKKGISWSAYPLGNNQTQFYKKSNSREPIKRTILSCSRNYRMVLNE